MKAIQFTINKIKVTIPIEKIAEHRSYYYDYEVKKDILKFFNENTFEARDRASNNRTIENLITGSDLPKETNEDDLDDRYNCDYQVLDIHTL